MPEVHTFNPVQYSFEENEFLLAHLGEPAVVALREIPPSVNAKAVKGILERVNELDQLKEHAKETWCGTEAVKASIRVYLREAKKWQQDHRRRAGAPRFPSMHTFDHRGRPIRGGPGSDGDTVQTYFDKEGNRLPLTIPLHEEDMTQWKPEWFVGKKPGEVAPEASEVAVPARLMTPTDQPSTYLKVDVEHRRVECLICGHTETFNIESDSSRRVALARLSKHMRSTKIEASKHREAHTMEFGA